MVLGLQYNTCYNLMKSDIYLQGRKYGTVLLEVSQYSHLSQRYKGKSTGNVIAAN